MMYMLVLSEGDCEWVVELYEQQQDRLYRISYSYLKSKEDAEEAVQESFAKIMDHIERIQELPCPQRVPFCVMIVKNTSIDILRKRNKLVDLDDEALHLMDEGDSVEDGYFRSADTQKLALLMEQLTDEERYFLQLRWFQEMPYQNIGKLFGISEEAAKKRGQRILHKLQKLYQKGGEQ